MDPLFALSPVDGRYNAATRPLAEFLSEGALIKYRVRIELEYLLALRKVRGIHMRRIRGSEEAFIKAIVTSFSEKDAALVKEFETKGYGGVPATNHDLKAVEYFIKERFKKATLADIAEWIHFGLTSEDTNNLAYALMLRDALEYVLLPKLGEVANVLQGFAKKYAALPMLARTHGQPASPTTLGKEFKVFEVRLRRQIEAIKHSTLTVKLNGATGNFNAHVAAYPKADWPRFAENFIKTLSGRGGIALQPNFFTTQIEPHDTYAELFDALRRANTVLGDCAGDMWRYISDGWLVQTPKEGEVGSSTMPHKLNPIDFENAEGNFGIANALLEHFSRKLPVSRLQRDLTDSTVERAFGTAFGHALVGCSALLRGFGKVHANEAAIRTALNVHPEVITEAIQTILRREGIPLPYEKLKELARGKEVALKDIHAFVNGLDVSEAVKKELRAITPENYIGLSKKIAEGL